MDSLLSEIKILAIKKGYIVSLKSFFLAISFLFIVYSCEKDDPLINKDAEEVFISEFINDINSDSLESNVIWLQDKVTRFALCDNRKEIAIDIQNKFKSIGYQNSYLDSFYLPEYSTWQYNVIASIEGMVSPDSICILGAHYDSFAYEPDPMEKAPGAHDNASGVAAVVEIARIMKLKKYTPKSTIKFIAFAAEEIGLYGSNDYAMKASQKGEAIKLMLNEDMIAYEPSNEKSTWKVNIIDYDNSVGLYLEADELANKFTELSTVNDNTYSNASDSYSFWIWGYKALFFISYTEDAYYHTKNDFAKNCNFEYCREITKLSCAILLQNN
ncbi:MAG: Zn-dependent exopeptidase M28 [Prolixibacteraceae bacterium]|nr:Zn-dependent exopeptidase M28 [Prolixibacteraceae bacterium]